MNPPRLEKRNVQLFDSEGAVIAGTSICLLSIVSVNSFSGFWQYGTLQWDEFYRCLIVFLVTSESTAWTIFKYDPVQQQQRGPLCLSGPQIVQPGSYVLLSSSGSLFCFA